MHLIDTNNAFRAYAEKSTSGRALREYFESAFFSPEVTIFVFDGPNALARRREIFPGYKVGRKRASDNFYLQLDILRELLHHTNKLILQANGWEADDLINHIVVNSPGQIITIDSTDKDFGTLACERVKVPKVQLDVAPFDIPLYKTLVGDESDKIPGLRLFGDKSWLELTSEHKQEWRKALNGAHPINPQVLGLRKPSHIDWVNENLSVLRSYWRVIQFFPVPPEVISKNLISGSPNYPLANKKLQEMFQ